MKNKKKGAQAEIKKADVNRYGLSRHIPGVIKQAVRKHSGFGCVICGLAINQYEHVDPEWHDAKEHDPAKMAALCAYDHDRVTRGFLSKETVKYWMANPKAKAKRYSKAELDLRTKDLTIILGGNTYINVTSPIGISGEPLFVVKAPVDTSFEYFLSAKFFDGTGKETLNIVNNKCYFSADNWDVDMVGGTFTIRDSDKKISLRLITKPPHTIVIDQINMKMNGWILTGDSKSLTITDPLGGNRIAASGNTHIGPTPPGHFHTHFFSQDDWNKRMEQKYKNNTHI